MPEAWIRAVMRQESAGEEQALSPAGAMGLMQVMPTTYAMLRDRYGLGNDPFEPHDNITAGAGYIREMYDRFGSPGFLAAYNAGPGRLDSHLATGASLPSETVSYVAAVAPRLGGGGPGAGMPLVDGVGTRAAIARVATPAGCDLDTAYDPARPCVRVAPAPVMVAAAPTLPRPVQYPAASMRYHPNPGMTARLPAAAPAPIRLAHASEPTTGADWAIQVGAFTTPAAARNAAGAARATLPALLGPAQVQLSGTEPFGPSVLFRARLVNLSATAAAEACAQLAGAQIPCLLVRPSRG